MLHIPSLRILPGEQVAIAGENGAGKSTLARLIARLYDPDSGSIRIGNVDIRNIQLKDLRRYVCYLPRDPVLFDGTFSFNLRFVRPASPDDGGLRVLWGADLKRAIEESKSQVKVGQIVAARVVRRERLYLEPHSKTAAGAQPAYRNRWEVETPQFVAQRQRFARAVNDSYQSARRSGVDDPESFALYLIHDGARRLAEQRFANTEDQQKFLSRVRRFFESSPEREALIAKAVHVASVARLRSARRSP